MKSASLHYVAKQLVMMGFAIKMNICGEFPSLFYLRMFREITEFLKIYTKE